MAIEPVSAAMFTAGQRRFGAGGRRVSLVLVVISLLNALAGLLSALTGFVLDNTTMILAGTILGGSGSILINLMAAMTRSRSATMGDGVSSVTARLTFGAIGRRTRKAGSASHFVDRGGR